MPPAAEVAGLRVLVPMKPLASAKMRLAAEVEETTRQGIALFMLHRVLGAIDEAVGAAACTVVGGDPLVEEVTRGAGASWTRERGHDLNSSLSLAMMSAWSEGARAALVVAADVPMIVAADIVDMIDASAGLTKPVGAQAMADGGTNALLWPAGVNFPPGFGDRSFSRHRASAAAAGAPLVASAAAGLAFDIDNPRDLDYARGAVPGFSEAIPEWDGRVRRWLAANAPRPAWADALDEAQGDEAEGRRP